MKKFLATAAFITTAAITNMLNAQSEPRLMADAEAKERVELSNRPNFFEALDNGDGTMTVVMVGQDPHWGMPGDPRSELHVLVNSENEALGYSVVALQKTKKHRGARAEDKLTFNAFPLNKKLVLDPNYHENLIANFKKFNDADAFLHHNYSNDQENARQAFTRAFVTEANAIAVIEDTFGVEVKPTFGTPRNNSN